MKTEGQRAGKVIQVASREHARSATNRVAVVVALASRLTHRRGSIDLAAWRPCYTRTGWGRGWGGGRGPARCHASAKERGPSYVLNRGDEEELSDQIAIERRRQSARGRVQAFLAVKPELC